jgi:hypothetical protein
MHETDTPRSRRPLWFALFSGMATGYLTLIGLYLLIG